MQIANRTSPPTLHPHPVPVEGPALWPWRAVVVVQAWSQGFLQQIGEEQPLLVTKKCGQAIGKVMGLESKSGGRWKSCLAVRRRTWYYLGWEVGDLALPCYWQVTSVCTAWTPPAHRFLSILPTKALGKAQHTAKCCLDSFQIFVDLYQRKGSTEVANQGL